uniref:Ycf1 protein n=1 Tax=Nonea vesicaria TaxID=256494 RepID=UPI001EE09B96|nr:Ycf1 protein [Nonea vesicaria]UJV31791.1 Ycf1 protein [Nonea vesicaria]
MIFQSFLLGNLVSLCMKIINSVVVVGLYYGFLTTFSIGPSYLFLLRAQVMEEGTEKKVSATTGFITGQLMMFISIYYAPLHLALGRPHTITVLALPYLLFHFFWNNHKHFGSTTRNSMRNLSIQCVFLNNLIFQLFNHFILPSSMLARLVNIYMFRCNNKMLFLTSSFLGWLIGHILFMKWLGLVLVWIRQNHSIRSNVLIRSNKYLVSEFINSMVRIFSILLFITCVYYLGRIPSPILTKKLKETSKTEESVESEEERDVEIETASEMRGMKQEQEGYTEEDPSPSLFSEEREDPDKIDETEEIRVNGREKTKDEFNFHFTETGYNNSEDSDKHFSGNPENSKLKILDQKDLAENKDFFWFWFEKPLVTLLFDYNRWNRPFRYIKNNRFERVVRNQMSQYFFDTCKSDGKQKISFTYPTSLSTFLEIINKKISLSTFEKIPLYQLSNPWIYINKQKIKNLNNEFKNIIQSLDNESFFLDRIETKTRLCTDDTKKEYLPIMYDPFLNGSYRGTIKKRFSLSIITSIENFKKRGGINRIHSILLPYTDSTDPNDQNIFKKDIRIKEISKKKPRWSYKLITELEQQTGEDQEDVALDHQIRSRKAKRVVIFTDTEQDTDPNTTNTETSDQTDELALIRYSQQSDFRRAIIKGSMRAQRRKIVIWELFQANVHSPLFLDRIKKSPPFSFDIFELTKPLFRNLIKGGAKLKVGEYAEEETKREKNKRKEIVQIEIAEAWDTIPFAQGIRGYMLITQSILRKYFIVPLLIIAKNIVRILLFQLPEWFEDLQEWNREIHVKCTYNGVPLSETEFPQNWVTDGIQIKILFPFHLKPWHRSNSPRDLKKKEKSDFSFLTVWGMEAELPFGSPRKRPSFFAPIIEELSKKIEKFKKKYFIALNILKGKTKFLLKVFKEIKKWIMKNVIFIKKLIKELNKILLFRFRLREAYKSNESKKEKDSTIRNQIIDESFNQIKPLARSKSSLKKKNKDLTDRINIIINQIERIKKEKKKRTSAINISPNKRSYNPKKFKSQKNIFQISKRINALLTYQFNYFIKFIIERIYIDIFLSIINIPRINTQLFLESTKKIIYQCIFNNEPNKEKMSKQNTSSFISTIKKSLDIVIKQNSHIFSDFSYLSQAYVFYRLSQTQVINLYKLQSVLQYQGTSSFLKTEIKDFFGTQGIFKTKFEHKKLHNYAMNDWKNWLRRHYQYDLSQIRWSRLIPQRWRNIINQRRMDKKKINKSESYDKNQLNFYIKKNDYEVYSLLNEKENFPKYNRYDLLSYKFLNYEKKRASSIYNYGLRLEIKNNQELFYNYNIHKYNFLDILEITPINSYLGKSGYIYIEKNEDRKYFDWKILKFYLKTKENLETWIQIDTKINQSSKTGTNHYQIVDKLDKKDLFYLTIHQEKKKNSTNITKRMFFDWMGMNEESPIPNLELWLFPEFLQLYNVYQIKPWIVRHKFILLNSTQNENIGASTNKNTNAKKISNKNKEEPQGQGNFGSLLSNQQKGIEENVAESDSKKRKKKKQYKSKAEAEMDLFLKRYLLFQLRWDDSLNQKIINNIKVYCLLLRLNNPRKITISSIQRGELSLDIMLIEHNLTFPELMKKGLFIIEPARVSVKNDGKFLMYQTISIYLVHKSKYKTSNQRYHEQGYIHKTHFNESISEYQKIIINRDKNNFNLLVPENILSSRRRRELRILICFNSKRSKAVDINTVCYNENWSKNIREKNELIQFQFFLWPNYRLEDLACMNRYWFNTNNGSRFSMLRIRMYPRFKT